MPFDATISSVASATLADFTRPSLIVPQLRERDTAGIISELSQVLQQQGCVPDVLPFYHTALNRELLTNSAQAGGLAFPHARLSGIKQLAFAFGRTATPVVWGAKSSWPVQLIFLLAVPATDAAGYLHLLGSLARLGQEDERLAELRNGENTDAIWAVLEKTAVAPRMKGA